MPSNPAFEAELLNSPAMRAALKEAGTLVAEYARFYDAAAHGPWMPRGGKGDTITVQEDVSGVVVANHDSAGHLIEWGSHNNPPHAPLRRGVTAAGLRFTSDPKP